MIYVLGIMHEKRVAVSCLETGTPQMNQTMNLYLLLSANKLNSSRSTTRFPETTEGPEEREKL